MILDVSFSRLFGMMSRVTGVSARSVRVMRRFFMMTALVVFGGLLMMARGMCVVF